VFTGVLRRSWVETRTFSKVEVNIVDECAKVGRPPSWHPGRLGDGGIVEK
jgi:hypothetical protein